jgi:O-antigen/teichoic acid export membrane protein
MIRVKNWLNQNRSLITNSGALVGTAIANSGLGFVYWWIATKAYEPAVVGLASATVSAMILLGSLAMLGLGTLLVGELARRTSQEEQSTLISTAIASVIVVGTLVAAGFALAASVLTDEFDVLTASPAYFVLFIVGVVLTALTLMLDQAFIGLMRGGVQLSRNIIASVLKVVLVSVFALLRADSTGMWIFAAWAISMLLSMLIPTRFLLREFGQKIRFQWSLLRELGRTALVHHWLNLALDAPIRAMPVIVTVTLSPIINASFYIAWMIGGLLFFPVQSLTLVLYAVGSQSEDLLAEKTRLTLRLSLLVAAVGYTVLFFTADLMMGLFGSQYATIAADALRIVSLAAFPLIIKDHFVAIHRIHNGTRYAAAVITVGGIIELVLATCGGILGSVNLLSAAWVFAIFLQAAYMLPTVLHTARIWKSPALVSKATR